MFALLGFADSHKNIQKEPRKGLDKAAVDPHSRLRIVKRVKGSEGLWKLGAFDRMLKAPSLMLIFHLICRREVEKSPAFFKSSVCVLPLDEAVASRAVFGIVTVSNRKGKHFSEKLNNSKTV